MRGLKLLSVETEETGTRRTPRGVRGLKFMGAEYYDDEYISRTPRGVRGLKSCD